MTPIHLVIVRKGLLDPLWTGPMHSTQHPAWGPPTVAECLGLNKLPRTQGHIVSSLMPHHHSMATSEQLFVVEFARSGRVAMESAKDCV